MAPQPKSRTMYRDKFGVPRPGAADRAEVVIDQERGIDAVEMVHGSGLHSWGVANGLRVRATRNKPSVWVEPGIAIDVEGRHISLAEGAELNDPPDPLNALPTSLTQVGALPLAIEVPTAGLYTGDRILTIQFWESFNNKLYTSSGYVTWRLEHLPWIRLQDPTAFTDDGADGIPLALVTLDAAGDVQRLDPYTRRQAGLPAGTIWVRRGWGGTGTGEGAAANDVTNVDAGIIRPRNTGPGPSGSGLEICVPTRQNEIHLQQANGKALSKIALAADVVTARRQDQVETVKIESSQATVTAGTGPPGPNLAGEGGTIIARAASGADGVTLEGNDASVVAGVGGSAGEIRARDANGIDSVVLDGQAGNVSYRGSLVDPNGAHTGVPHADLAELTGRGPLGPVLTALHRHLAGNAARPAHAVWLSSSSAALASRTFFFPPGTTLLACIALSSIDPSGFWPINAGDSFLAEILRVNGLDYRSIVSPTPFLPNFFFDSGIGNLGPSGNPANLRAPLFAGTATSITFRVRSTGPTTVWALALIFREM